MSDYASSSVQLFYGSTSAPTDAIAERVMSATPASPVRHQFQRVVANTSTGAPIDQEEFAVIAEFYVRNLDTTNFVTFTYTSLSANTAQYEKILPGQWVKINDVKISGSISIVADTAACVCEVWAVGT